MFQIYCYLVEQIQPTMRKILRCLFVLLICHTQAFSQRNFELGLSAGVTDYFGDLGNDDFVQTSSTRPGMALTLRNFLGKPKFGYQYHPFNVEARVSWHRIGYDETKPLAGRKGHQLRNYGRGLGFRTDVFGSSVNVTYTLYADRRKMLSEQQAALFLFIGAGIYYAEPKADLFRGKIDIANRYYFWSDGTVRDKDESTGEGNIIEKDGKFETNLKDWHTEGEGARGEFGRKSNYSYFHIGIPLGFGFRYGLGKSTTLSVEFGYYKFMTDFLDDASDGYASYDEIVSLYPNDPQKQLIARYISDPTGRGTIGYPGPATSARGNPKTTDGYSFLNMEIAYKFEFEPRKWARWF
jgi:hypothetical protein